MKSPKIVRELGLHYLLVQYCHASMVCNFCVRALLSTHYNLHAFSCRTWL